MNRIEGLLPVLALSLVLGACESTMGPSRNATEIAIVSGDGQLTGAAGELHEPLVVVVRQVENGQPLSDVTVQWAVASGDGVVLSQESTVTDSLGRTSIGATLGPAIGVYEIEADFEGRAGLPSRFEAFAVEAPEIFEVSDSPVTAGETIRLVGRHFRAESDENIVVFSGFRGEVLSATEDELTVRVPPCLPSRRAQVSVFLSPTVQGDSVPVDVLENGAPAPMELGEHRSVNDSDALSCFRLPDGATARYVAVSHSASTHTEGAYAYGLFGLSEASIVASAEAHGIAIPDRASVSDLEADAAAGSQSHWDGVIREREEELLPVTAEERASARSRSFQVTAPALGDQKEFSVLNRAQEFETVMAEVRHVGSRAVLYQDLAAPDGGLTAEDFQAFSEEFDETIFPAVTDVFGETSDLDENGRIIILFTPQVNRLTLPGSSGFVGGFFYGLDLLPDREGSNEAEVFYALVPDPNGEFGDSRSKDLVLDAVPAILAHEFQHMVHFNERVLVRSAATTEALWLSEALAQMAEDVVSEAVSEGGDTERAARYQGGNFSRGRRYLAKSHDVSLIPVSGGGTIEERGAGWLFLRYLRGHSDGGNSLLRALTQTNRTGIANVLAESGREWNELISSWSAALYLDGLGLPVESRLEFPDIDLREALTPQGGSYPLTAKVVGPGDFREEGGLRSGSPAYYVIRPASGGTSVNLSAPGGLPTLRSSRIQLTVVRIQ